MSEPSFDRGAIRAFRFLDCSFDAGTGEARLAYAFDDGPRLVEVVRYPNAPYTLSADRAVAVRRALRLLHFFAGVSYYKAAVPPTIEVEGEPMDAAMAAFLQDLYENGLGEFAYRNGLSLRGKIVFPHADAAAAPATALGLQPRALVAIGGGKDSLVSIEALRRAGVEQTATWIGASPLIRACAERAGLPMLNIGRSLAPELFEYNKLGALNGHIPVTAVNSAILALGALLEDSAMVVFSNEHSASYGSLIPGTGEVNHQWSKGWGFERGFAALLRSQVAADLDYFSLLRPFSELAVARQFARSDHYDAHFSSCNRNFHLLGERPAQRWCGACPEMPVRLPRAGALHAQAAADGHLRPQPARRAGPGAGLRCLAGVPGPQALRMRGRGQGVTRGHGGAGGQSLLAGGRAGGAFRPRHPAPARPGGAASGAAARSIG